MITAKLVGGLGNQMFIIATAYALAIDNNDECAFDLSQNPVFQGNGAYTYKENIFKKVKELSPLWKPNVIYKEPSFSHTPILYQKDMILNGYFASGKYFNRHRDDIITLFKDTATIDSIKTSFENSVSMHVRRGDYLRFSDVYIQPTPYYYNKALEFLHRHQNIERVYVLSDDIRWCKENLSDPRMEFIDTGIDYLDLYTMSLCKHNILANSSFSWWGTYLNQNDDKIVIAPKVWFKKKELQVNDIFCDNWITIDAI